MSPRIGWLIAVVWLAALTVQAAEPPVRKDANGEPLPEGAVARLGRRGILRLDGVIDKVALSSDFKTLAVVHRSGDKRVLCLWNMATGEQGPSLDSEKVGAVEQLAFAPDGSCVAALVGHHPSSILFWHIGTGKRLHTEMSRADHKITNCLAFSPDSKTMATGDYDGSCRLWDLESGKELRRFEGLPRSIRSVAFSPDGKRLLSCCDGLWKHENNIPGIVLLWETATGKILRQFNCSAIEVAYTVDGQALAVAMDHEVHSLFADQILAPQKSGPHGTVLPSPAGKVFAIESGWNGITVLHDVRTGKGLHKVAGAPIGFSPDGKQLATIDGRGGEQRVVRIWNVGTAKEHRPLGTIEPRGGHTRSVTALAYARDGATLASAGLDGAVCIWNWKSGEMVHQHLVVDRPRDVVLAADGRTVAIAKDQKVSFWNVADGKRLQVLSQADKDNLVDIVALSRDGRRLVITSEIGRFEIWDVAHERLLHSFRNGGVSPNCMAISPEGSFVLIGGTRGKNPGRLLHPSSGQELARFDDAFAAIFAPDGKMLAVTCTKGGDHFISLIETASGQPILQIRTASVVSALAFSSDSRLLAAGGGGIDEDGNRVVRLFGSLTGKRLAYRPGHHAKVNAVAFAPDGRTFASASDDTTILVWETPDLDQAFRYQMDGLELGKVEECWQELQVENAAKAYPAIWRLVADPKPAIAFLRKHLQPARLANRDRIAQLIGDLDSKKFAERQQATDELEKIGEPTLPALRQVLEERPSLEVLRRAQRLIARLERMPSPESLRAIRATMVLEQIGSEEARRLLEDLTKGDAEARLTREAKAALLRMK